MTSRYLRGLFGRELENVDFRKGVKAGINAFAYTRDGKQYVGASSTNQLLEDVLEELREIDRKEGMEEREGGPVDIANAESLPGRSLTPEEEAAPAEKTDPVSEDASEPEPSGTEPVVDAPVGKTDPIGGDDENTQEDEPEVVNPDVEADGPAQVVKDEGAPDAEASEPDGKVVEGDGGGSPAPGNADDGEATPDDGGGSDAPER
jgi:hypothetical protein